MYSEEKNNAQDKKYDNEDLDMDEQVHSKDKQAMGVVDKNNHVERANAFIIEVLEEMRTTTTSCLTEAEEDTLLEEKHLLF